MNEKTEFSQEEVDKLYEQLNKDARAGGYNLNPPDFLKLVSCLQFLDYCSDFW